MNKFVKKIETLSSKIASLESELREVSSIMGSLDELTTFLRNLDTLVSPNKPEEINLFSQVETTKETQKTTIKDAFSCYGVMDWERHRSSDPNIAKDFVSASWIMKNFNISGRHQVKFAKLRGIPFHFSTKDVGKGHPVWSREDAEKIILHFLGNK